MTRSEWIALAKRCEGAEGPDREIDARIAAILRPDLLQSRYRQPELGKWVRMDGRPDVILAPACTASLDAITSLIERELPATWTWTLGQNIHHRQWVVSINNLDEDGAPYSVCLTGSRFFPALALCAAFCRAMAERTQA